MLPVIKIRRTFSGDVLVTSCSGAVVASVDDVACIVLFAAADIDDIADDIADDTEDDAIDDAVDNAVEAVSEEVLRGVVWSSLTVPIYTT